MKGTMIIVRPDVPWRESEMRTLSAPPEGRAIHELVGGFIEAVPGFVFLKIKDGKVPCVAFCNEDGKRADLNLPTNDSATLAWEWALQQQGESLYRAGVVRDVLVGTVVIVTGDSEFMESL